VADAAGGPLVRTGRAASSAARMRELGFDRTTMYRGQPDWRQVDELGMFSRSNNNDFDPIWFTNKQPIAEGYASADSYLENLTSNPGVRQFVTRSEKPLIIELAGEEWDNIPISKLKNAIPKNKINDFEKIAKTVLEGQNTTNSNQITEIAQMLGFDSVDFKNLSDAAYMSYDSSNPLKYASDVRAIFNPNQVRYPTARFDPAQRESSDLLAGLALPAIFTGGAVANQRRKRED
jgi:hypothetical protein